MDVLLIALVIGAIAVLASTQLRKRKSEPPSQSTLGSVPQQLDRRDFDRPDAPWLTVAFTSATCDSCKKVVPMAEVLRSDYVAVQIVEYQDDPELHKRYAIDSVPTIVIADVNGVVGKSFIGPPSATDLWAAVAELREPGSTPPPEAHTPKR